MGNLTSKLTSLATLSIQDSPPQSKIQHGSSTTGLEDPPQGEWVTVYHSELDRNNNKMENKVSAAQSASKASAPLGVRKSLGIRDIIVCCFLEIVSPRLI